MVRAADGAGDWCRSIGLLAALLGVQRRLEVHDLDRVRFGPKPSFVADLGAVYHTGDVAEVAKRIRLDVVIEATGVGQVVFDCIAGTATCGVVCLTGVSPKGRPLALADAGWLPRLITRRIRLERFADAFDAHPEDVKAVLTLSGRPLCMRRVVVGTATEDRAVVGAIAEDREGSLGAGGLAVRSHEEGTEHCGDGQRERGQDWSWSWSWSW
ncbi:hypothetical protein GCM10009789_37870 [Kribbella sancticallisti]|uniref:Glucose dehydrogenase C-terminal domain-containing protein n=1 Tax=Kribbella sancticallisti TaxID=460087 RepID=A0ABN2DPR0_9ACTN